MSKIVFISHNDKNLVMPIIKQISHEEVILCRDIKSFADCFLNNKIDAFVLDFTDEIEDDKVFFEKFYYLFVHNIPKSKRIILGNNESDENQVPVSLFEQEFANFIERQQYYDELKLIKIN